MNMATLDITKAFESVDHTTLLAAAEAAVPLPRWLPILGITTRRAQRVTREVKQGDPLPPVIFNIIMDHLLQYLPQQCGGLFNNTIIRAVAFADDLVLRADSPTGLQHLIDHTKLLRGQA